MTGLHYFFRHPSPVYFSIEKLFGRISNEVALDGQKQFNVDVVTLPYTTKVSTMRKNISYTKRNQAFVNHITGDAHYCIIGCDNSNINVLTIHDCVLLKRYRVINPKYWIFKWFWYDLPVRKADAITVISENTKAELLKFTRCRPEKITVIPDFVDPIFTPAEYHFNGDLPRILFIGSSVNKNLDRLLDAIRDLPVRLDLICRLREEQKTKLANYGIQYTVSENLTDSELLKKYEECDLLAFPSTYEGFGLPIVEAQAVGRPVLTSRISPMKDVAGKGARLVDPYNTQSIREGIQAIIGEADYRKELIRSGFENVARFQLKDVVDQYVSLYHQLLEKRRKKE
ncbi:MAG TPA: glycosyltransferase family 1 protein [Puia sp.]|nr:glycosyltransferase family 1 protein [Puia sp.]